tara:strand:- start:36496 stop:37179 length:684 start_codon:yes stop_codon:yes gene_type:complete
MFSIVIPVYNEKNNIKVLIEEILISIKKKYIFEIIIVNDCSTDDTLLEINKLSFKSLLLLTNNKNMGQSYSIAKGIKKSKFDTIITIDADGQNDPKDILSLVNLYFSKKNISLIGGIRKNRKDSLIKIYSSIIANKFRAWALNDNCPDTGCALKIFNKNIFLSFPYFDGIHRFLPALFKGFGHKTQFIIVNHRSRLSGKSKYGTFDRLFKGLFDIIRVKIILNKSNK